MKTYLLKNGKSGYKIVIPEPPADYMKFVAGELQYFFKLSTGVELPIISEAAVTDTKGKYLSLGNTKILRGSGLSVTAAELGRDGYKVETFGDAVIMAGATDEATGYAVYGYLGKQFNLRIYSEDVFTCDTPSDAFLIDIHWTDLPDIPMRTGGTWYAMSGRTQKGMSRYRMRHYLDKFLFSAHSHFEILPPDMYIKDHPQWYNGPAARSQLAWADKDMRDEFVKRLKEIILAKPDAIYINFAAEDVYDTGRRHTAGDKAYDAIAARYGGSDSAVFLDFHIEVANRINAWMAAELPGREVMFSVLAYQFTEIPPVKFQNWKYTVLADELIPPDNMAIMVAPYGPGSNASHPYSDTVRNERSSKSFAGWASFAPKLFVWQYAANFYNYLLPYNGWGSIKRNFMDYKAMKVHYFFENGAYNQNAPVFAELRQYLLSQLSWDSSQDAEWLIVNFFTAFYGAGWQDMYVYFNLLRNHLSEFENDPVPAYAFYNTITVNILQKKYFSKEFLDRCESLCAKAVKAADATGDARARAAVEADRLQIRFIMLELYCEEYDTEACLTMIDDFRDITAKRKITSLSEGKTPTPEEFINKWTGRINKTEKKI